MKNVAPKARSFDSERPLTIAAIACSRMPKWRFLPPGLPGLEVSRALVRQRGLVRRAEIRRAAEEPGNVLREHVEHLARGFPAGDALGIRREDREVAIPSRRQLAPLHLVDLGRQFGIRVRMTRRALSTGGARPGAPRTDAGREVLADAVGNQELRVFRPSVAALGQSDLLLAERLAVGCGSILFVRRAVADVAVQNDEGRPALGLPEDGERLLDAIDVVGVAHSQHVPAVRQEPGCDVLGEGEAGRCPSIVMWLLS